MIFLQIQSSAHNWRIVYSLPQTFYFFNIALQFSLNFFTVVIIQSIFRRKNVRWNNVRRKNASCRKNVFRLLNFIFCHKILDFSHLCISFMHISIYWTHFWDSMFSKGAILLLQYCFAIFSKNHRKKIDNLYKNWQYLI